jgi:hypothetical protein
VHQRNKPEQRKVGLAVTTIKTAVAGKAVNGRKGTGKDRKVHGRNRMSVPILLGEDFQLTYELVLTRNVELGTKIHFQDWEYTVKAQNVMRTPDFNRILLSNKSTMKLNRAQVHRN